jgi:hypothetical protein
MKKVIVGPFVTLPDGSRNPEILTEGRCSVAIEDSDEDSGTYIVTAEEEFFVTLSVNNTHMKYLIYDYED